MKNDIKTLEDALEYQLQGLLYIEKRLKDEYTVCSPEIHSGDVRTEIKHYTDSGDEKALKLERVFNYLMREPEPRKNEVINQMLEETHHLLKYATSANLKDILMVTCVQKINAYKAASYRTAYRFAVELELDTPADLLQEIIQWEAQTSEALAALAVSEFNRSKKTIKSS